MRVMLAEMKLIRIKNKMLGFFINLQEHMIIMQHFFILAQCDGTQLLGVEGNLSKTSIYAFDV